MPAISSAAILKAVACPLLTLERISGHGYWIFVFDDGGARYETESVYCVRLNDMTLEQWVDIGRSFVAKQEAEH